MSIKVPKRFPFPGSGPDRDFRWDLQQYQPGQPATAESWRAIEDAHNYLRGRHKKEFHGMPIFSDLYSGGAHPLTSFAVILIGPNAASLECFFWVEMLSSSYDFTISESVGANSTTVTIPQGIGSARLHATLSLSGAGTSLTTLSIQGDAGASAHPELYTVHWRIAQEERY